MLDFIAQPLEPGGSVLVVQRDPMLHLFDVGRWMEIIRIEKDPIEFSSDLHSDRRLSGTGYTHENDCLRMVRFHTGMNRLLTWGGSQGDRRQNPEFRSQEPGANQKTALFVVGYRCRSRRSNLRE